MWWKKFQWNWGYSAKSTNRAWLTWKQSMRKPISSTDISIGKRPCVGVCAQRRAPEIRGRNIWLWIKAPLICLYYSSNTNIHIRHMCYNCRTQKKNPITKVEHHSQHEGKRYWRQLRKWRNVVRSPDDVGGKKMSCDVSGLTLISFRCVF